MSCKYIEKECARCSRKDDYLVFDKDQDKTLSLKKYNDYVNFDLEVCPFCGYISTSIDKDYSEDVEYALKSKDFNIAYTYDYLKDIQEKLDENFLDSYPANLYECYGILREEAEDYENAIKGYYRAILLKETLVRRYTQQKLEDREDEDEETLNLYDQINKKLVESIKNNIQDILDIYNLCYSKEYIDLIYIECLLRFNEHQKAKTKFEQIKNNLPKDIIDYIQDLL